MMMCAATGGGGGGGGGPVCCIRVTGNGPFLRSIFFNTTAAAAGPAPSSISKPSLNRLFFRNTTSPAHLIRPFSPVVMEWQDCTAKLEVDVPYPIAYKCYSDREAIARWMPFISSVKILEDQPDLSRWSLKYKAFGQDLEFSWLARNMQPIPNQKIHWRSLEGLPNKGAVRFYPKGPAACRIDLTVSYEVPQILTPVSSALRPFLEGLLLRGLERFAKFAKEYQVNSQNT